MQIVIAGAGIGGLTLALMLHRRGIECRVYESAQELRPLGVGINLLPHAVSELEQLGLMPALAERAIETSQLHYYNKFGQPIWREPRGVQAGYPLPQFSVHRGEFQMLLAQAVRDRLGNDAIVTGMALESAEQDADGATAVFRRRADGSLHRVRGDILVKPTASIPRCAANCIRWATNPASLAACCGVRSPRPCPTWTGAACSWPVIRTRSSSATRSLNRCAAKGVR